MERKIGHKFVSKYRKWIYLMLALPVSIGVIFQLIYYFIYPLAYVPWPKFHLAILPFAELILLFGCIDIHNRNREKQKSTLGWQLAFIYSSINLITVFMLEAYYEKLAQYSSAQLVLSYMPAVEYILVFSIVLCLWMGFRRTIISTWNTFTFLENAPQIRTWHTITILLTCFTLGLGLRLYNLGGFPPYIDEYIHTHTAIALMDGESVEYGRAFLTVSLPVFISYRIFGISLWASRLPMVIINMLAIFPLYALGKRINRGVGYISVVLFVISPWMIAVSRTVRDYAVVPVFFYLAAVLLIDLLDWDGLSIKRYLCMHKYRLVVVALILGYSIFDRLSILKIILALYGIFGTLVILKTFKRKPSRWLKIAIPISGVALILLMIARNDRFVHSFIEHGSIVIKQAPTYWNSLVDSNVRQWYFIKEIGYGILLIGVFFAIRAIFSRYSKHDYRYLFCFMVFAANLVYLTYLLVDKRIPERPRYGALLEYWYVIVVAVVLFVFINIVRQVPSRRLSIFLVLTISGLFINYPAIHELLSYRGGETFEITGENHYIVEPAYKYLVERLTEKDVLLSDIIENYDEISGRRFHALDYFSYFNLVLEKDFTPLEIIEQYPRGWIAVVSPIGRPAFSTMQFSDFVHDGKYIDSIGFIGEIYLWHWDEMKP